MALDSLAVFNPLDRITDANGDPVSGGTIEFYAAGTSTPKTVYADADLTVSLGTTVATNSGGYPVTGGGSPTLIYVGTDDYKMIVKDAAGSTLVTHDNIAGAPVIPTASSTALPSTPVVTRSSTYAVLTTDQGKIINCYASSFPLTLPNAASAGDGWRVCIRHIGSSTSAYTVRTSGGQTITFGSQTKTSFALTGFGESVWISCDGSGYHVDSHANPLMKDGLPFFKVVDRLASPPTSPDGGARYIISGSPTGVWSTLGFTANQIAEADGNGSWFAYTPLEGWFAYDADQNIFTYYNGSAWTDFSNVEAPTTSRLKIGIFTDTKSQNTSGGTPTAGAWTKGALNTTGSNTLTTASIASDVLTLGTGYYMIRAVKLFFSTNNTQIRLRNTTTGTTIATSPNAYIANYTSGTGPATIATAGQVTVIGYVNVTAATENIELQYHCQTNSGNGLGVPRNIAGESEVYTVLEVLDLTSIQGPRGADGAQGADGLDAAFSYQWSTSTSGDPGTGKCRFNNSDPTLATEFAISEIDAYGTNIANNIAVWDDSSSSARARVRLQKEGSPGTVRNFTITGASTDAGAYWTFPITWLGNNGTLNNGDDLALLVVERGDRGDAGPTGPTGPTSFDWEAGTTDADPGSGKIRLNNASPASATAAYVSIYNRSGSDVSAWLETFDDAGVSAGRGVLRICDSAASATRFALYNVTGSVTTASGYRKLTLSYIAGTGSFVVGNEMLVNFDQRGTTGLGDLTAANNLSDVASARTSRRNLGAKFSTFGDYGVSHTGSSKSAFDTWMTERVGLLSPDMSVDWATYYFNTAPNEVTGYGTRLLGLGISVSGIERRYNAASDTEGFVTVRGDTSNAGRGFVLKDMSVTGGNGSTGGALLKAYASGPEHSPSYGYVDNILLNYGGGGSAKYGILLDGSLNDYAGGQGVRDWRISNVFAWQVDGVTIAALRAVNATSLYLHNFWTTAPIQISGAGASAAEYKYSTGVFASNMYCGDLSIDKTEKLIWHGYVSGNLTVDATMNEGVFVGWVGNTTTNNSPKFAVYGDSIDAVMGINIRDSDRSHKLLIQYNTGQNLTANRTLSIDVGDATRTLSIRGNATIDQDYSTTGSPQFAGVNVGHASDTTITRVSAGVIAVEGNTILTAATGQPIDSDLTALAALSTTGMAARTAADTWALRTITGTSAEITVTNGNGVSGNPTLSLPTALTFTGKTVTGGTFAGIGHSGATTFPGSTQIDASGLVGIGKAPSWALDITTPYNIGAYVKCSGSSSSSYASLRVENDSTKTIEYGVTSDAYSGAYVTGGPTGVAAFLVSTGSGTPLVFGVQNSFSAMLTTAGSFKLGGTANRGTTEGTNQVVIFNGTAPVGTLTNGASLYVTSGEMRVMDSAGNATLISPHDAVTNEWVYDSTDTRTGRKLRIRMEKMMKLLNERFGLNCVEDTMPIDLN